MSDDDKKPSPKRRRQITPFICQELLYDYALERLDAERSAAVAEFLKTDAECQSLLDGIRLALSYTQELAATQIKPEILASLDDSENVISLSRRYSSWRAWPETFRWTVAALSVSALVAMSISLIPWRRLSSLKSADKKDASVIELAQIGNPQQSADKAHVETTVETDGEPEEAVEDTGSGDEEIEIAGHPVKGSVPPAQQVQLAQSRATPTPTPTPKPIAGAPSSRGFVYRAFMNLKDLDDVGPKIATMISELEGTKAGEVELGWKRGTGRYYHFALPQANEDKLLELLRAYGPVRMSKDPHSRIMPEGQVRFILWIEPL